MPNSNRNIREEKDTNLISFVRFRFVPYWPLFGLLVLIACTVAFAYLHWAPPAYETTADLLIKDEKKGSDDGKMLESLNIFTTKKTVEDEIEVLQSQTLMKEVVRNLHLYAPVYAQGRFKATPAYTSSPVQLEVLGYDSLYKEHRKFYVEKQPFRMDSTGSNVVIDSQAYPMNQWVTIPHCSLLVRFANNPHYVADTTSHAATPFWFSLVNPKVMTNNLVKGLGVSSSNKLSSVVTITHRDEIPQRGEDIVNELIRVYNHASINDKNQLAINTLTFIEKRLQHVKAELDSAEATIQRHKTQNGGADLSEQSTAFLKSVSDNDTKATDLNMQLAVLGEVEKYVKADNGASGIVPATLGLNDEGLSNMLQKLYDARANYERLSKTTGENNPILSSLSTEISKIRPTILENIRIRKLSLEAGLANLNANSNTYTARLESVPVKERALLESSRRAAILNNVFAFLLQKREEASLSYASTVSDSRTVNLAESTIDPVSPKRSMVLAIALLVAIAAGGLIVYAKEFFCNRILFRHEIETFTAAPIIAELPNAGKKASLQTAQARPSFLGEQFRQLRAALGLHTRNNGRKKILVTSSISGEGKSFISTHLAQSLAAAGKKVILLDLDLRNPKLSVEFDVLGEPGISDFLEGDWEPYEIIKSTTGPDSPPGLFIAGAGRDSLNAPELTFNKKLQDLFDYLEGVFDFIIVDTAPVNPVSDAYVLAEYCDITLYVIRHDYTPKAFIRLLDENNKIKPLKDLVIVFNSIKSRGMLRGQYGLDLGYGNEFAMKSRRSVIGKKTIRKDF
jgi:capsular exopolysaccharide synthesis family protein